MTPGMKPAAARRLSAAALLLTPTLLLMIARGMNWIAATSARAITLGMLVAALGGLVSGTVGQRMLRQPQGELQIAIGVAATTLLASITVGYLYLIHLDGPLAELGTLSRAIEQVIPFVGFLTGMAAGVILTMPAGGDSLETDTQCSDKLETS